MTKVLFIGNSYTYFNNMPMIFKDLTIQSGEKVEVSSVSNGGADFEWHWFNPATLDAIDGTNWDYISLQGKSTEPDATPDRMARFAKKLSNRVEDSKTVFYLTWARKRIPEMQMEINSAYFRLARELDALISPVGIAWELIRNSYPEIELFTEDGSHPNTVGSYLSAITFYSTIFNESPVGISNEYCTEENVKTVIDPAVAEKLQNAVAASLKITAELL